MCPSVLFGLFFDYPLKFVEGKVSIMIQRALLQIVLLLYGVTFAVCYEHVMTAYHETTLSDIAIECNSNNIKINVKTGHDNFNGMIYPKGLSKNSSCLMEYEHAGSSVTYILPLRSCNTMNHDVNDGVVEYYNTVVLQPHSKLVTALGRGFHVRCRYEKNNTTVHSGGESKSLSEKKKNMPPLPSCMMKIFKGRPEQHVVAEHVKIGDYLTLSINIEKQEHYGIFVTNCVVRDGLNWSEEPLINNEGCPINEEIMGSFEYSKDLTTAHVTYPAFKFPFSSSIYYRCNVKLCLKESGGCTDVPPICDAIGNNVRVRRRKRQSGAEVDSSGNLDELRLKDENLRDRSVDVYTGLLVNEVDELDEDTDNPSSLSTENEEDFCLSTRKFAIGIAIAGVLLMLAIVFLVACIVQRRRRKKGTSTNGSSIYSGPYSNHAYSRD
ncbi:hypothetical protein JTE90_015119 [Oedothorax gibbosus]|uniref:ZP domain-containing protein n=1 Tax=Oedothorax gibbosus TaxID=931172 RepID=A0AAV6VQ94_9ARAC|nr:hypothetical protein JTE90_015119 [Oedothorax gibbosus]